MTRCSIRWPTTSYVPDDIGSDHGDTGRDPIGDRDPKKSCDAAWAGDANPAERHQIMIDAVQTLAAVVGVMAACAALAVPRSTYYRTQQPAALPPLSRPRRIHPRALTPDEQIAVRAQLNQERFVDQA